MMDVALYNNAIIAFNIDFSSALSDIFTLLVDLRKLLMDDWLEDDYEEDSIIREKRRAEEFSRTISRNILFPLYGQICKLENETIAFQVENNDRNDYERSDILRNLLMCICRSVKRAVQNYLRFVRSSIMKQTPKMVCLLSYIVQVYEISAIIVRHKALHIYNLTEISCEIMKLNVKNKQGTKYCKDMNKSSKKLEYPGFQFEHCTHCTCCKQDTWEPVETRNGVKYLCIYMKEPNNFQHGYEKNSKKVDDSFEQASKFKQEVVRVCDEICESLTSEITTDISHWMDQLVRSIFHTELFYV